MSATVIAAAVEANGIIFISFPLFYRALSFVMLLHGKSSPFSLSYLVAYGCWLPCVIRNACF